MCSPVVANGGNLDFKFKDWYLNADILPHVMLVTKVCRQHILYQDGQHRREGLLRGASNNIVVFFQYKSAVCTTGPFDLQELIPKEKKQVFRLSGRKTSKANNSRLNEYTRIQSVNAHVMLVYVVSCL